MSAAFIRLQSDIMQLREENPTYVSDQQGFHVERDRILWSMVNAAARSDLTVDEIGTLRNLMRSIMKKPVWYA